MPILVIFVKLIPESHSLLNRVDKNDRIVSKIQPIKVPRFNFLLCDRTKFEVLSPGYFGDSEIN
jgi:hypothetical protein